MRQHIVSGDTAAVEVTRRDTHKGPLPLPSGEIAAAPPCGPVRLERPESADLRCVSEDAERRGELFKDQR